MRLENISSGQFWTSALVAATIDVVLILILTWRIQRSFFRELKWTLASVAAISWSLFAIYLVSVFWDPYYSYFYPGWARSGGILFFVPIVFGGLALAFHWLALHLPGNPILTFCLLAGTESLVEHAWGMYGLKILQIPWLQGASPVSILAFCFPEYIFYWCVVIGLAALIQNGWRGLTAHGLARTRTTS